MRRNPHILSHGGRIIWPAVLRCALLALVGLVSAGGQNGLTKEEKERELQILSGQLSEDRRAFARERARATSSANDYFVQRLEKFERQAAAEGNYGMAIRMRDERLRILEDSVRADPASARQGKDSAIVLKPREAALYGSVTLKSSALQRWRTSKSNASWKLRGIKPGHYQVVATYACSSKVEESVGPNGLKIRERAGGQFTLGEQSNLIGSNDQLLTHQVLPTKDWNTDREALLGEIELNAANLTLQLDVVEVQALGLMHLKEIRLYPLARPASPSDSPALTPLREIRRSFVVALQRRLQPIRQRYLQRLEHLRAQAESNDDPVLIKAIDQAIGESSITDHP